MRVRLDIAYDGRNFFGYQRQKQERTVQGELEDLLSLLYKSSVHLHASGRTDSGVHALQQVCAFDTQLRIPEDKLFYVLNQLAPSDLKILAVQEASLDFHPRFDAVSKTYQYKFMLQDDLFQRPYKVYLEDQLDFDAIDQAITVLQGTHDFFSFSNRRRGENSTIRTMEEIRYERTGQELVFSFKGDGFLYKMVRIVMQYLLEVGRKRVEAGMTQKILDSRSREFTRKVAPPQGLYLYKVVYQEAGTFPPRGSTAKCTKELIFQR